MYKVILMACFTLIFKFFFYSSLNENSRNILSRIITNSFTTIVDKSPTLDNFYEVQFSEEMAM